MPKVGVRIIHGNIEILSEFSKSQGAYYAVLDIACSNDQGLVSCCLLKLRNYLVLRMCIK